MASFCVSPRVNRAAIRFHAEGGTNLEVITKGPVAKHFKVGVVIRITSDVLEICVSAHR